MRLTGILARSARLVRWLGLCCGAIGFALAAFTAASAQGLIPIRDTEIENLLNDYAQPIFRAAKQPTGRIRVVIVKNEAFNAFVLDGRRVFIHTGTLLQSDNPNQVIGVIAHETGHIEATHVAQAQAALARTSTRLLLLRALGIGVAVLTGKGEAVAAGDELLIRSFLAERRLQEGAADQAGLRYLEQTRQSAKGMLETFERFAQQEYLTDGSKDPFVRSHPIPTDRLNNLRARVQASAFYATKDPPALQLRHDLMRAKLSGYLEAPHVVNNRYPVSDKSMPARYARAIAKFFRGGQGALESAVADIEQLIRERPDYPYFHELRGDLMMRGGKTQEAIPSLRKALQLTDNASLIQVQLASALLSGNEPAAVAESIDMLRRAMIVDPDPRGFRLLGTAYYKQGKQPESEASQAQALLLEGRLEEAQTFAKRAKRGLTAKSPLWLKMDDIITAKPSENG